MLSDEKNEASTVQTILGKFYKEKFEVSIFLSASDYDVLNK